MLAIRTAHGTPIEPFGERAIELPILGTPLGELQERLLAEHGVSITDTIPKDQPWLWIGDDLWFTPTLLRKFLATCPPTGGQLAVDGVYRQHTESLQDLDAEGRLPLALLPSGATLDDLASLPPITVDQQLVEHTLPLSHPAFAGVADRPFPVTAAMAHTIRHWAHLMQVNQLALLSFALHKREHIEASVLRKIGFALKIFWRAKSIHPAKLEAAVTEHGKGCKIHPTAVIEASILGDDVTVGAGVVIRHSWIGNGVQIGDQVRVTNSVIHERSIVAPQANIFLCLLLPHAFVSAGVGHQISVFGRESFIAAGVTIYDLSFGGPIKTQHRGERVSSGVRFLGACIGHRARIGPHVRIGYGETIPNDSFLVADPDQLVRDLPVSASDGEPRFVRNRQLYLVKGPR